VRRECESPSVAAGRLPAASTTPTAARRTLISLPLVASDVIRLAVVALVCCLLVAGCAGPVEPGSATPDAETTAAPDAAESTATPTAASPGANPWGDDPVVVAVADGADPNRNVTPLVREATAYWEQNAERYAGYGIDYRVRPDAANPDLRIEFTETVPACGEVTDAVGCAPLVTDARQLDRPETVWVKGGLSDRSSVLVVKHELGHTLGLTHDDAPAAVMAAQSVLSTQPKPNATERDYPWADSEFTVHVGTANASNPAGASEQVDRALDYYAAGAPGMPDNLTFRRVADPDDAEIVVEFSDTSPCGPDDETGSCVGTRGIDPDGDGAIERYERTRITLVGLDTDAVGWHVGYWLAYALGAEDDPDKPDPFRDASYEERRSEWWR
jgi:hypothetical protein